MATEVIHTKTLEDGSKRVTLDEPHGIVQGHRKVVVRVEGMKYDHSGTRLMTKAGRSVEMPYEAGEEVGYLEILLAGQTQFTVPKEAVSIEFDDGVSHTLQGDPTVVSEDPAPAATA